MRKHARCACQEGNHYIVQGMFGASHAMKARHEDISGDDVPLQMDQRAGLCLCPMTCVSDAQGCLGLFSIGFGPFASETFSIIDSSDACAIWSMLLFAVPQQADVPQLLCDHLRSCNWWFASVLVLIEVQTPTNLTMR